MRFKITFKRGVETIAEVRGLPRRVEAMEKGDVNERIIETEQYLERLTGLRVHINVDLPLVFTDSPAGDH